MEFGATIFVVDDEAEVRDGLARLLRSMGHGVSVYASADEFLSAAQSQASGCVLLDMSMPGMTGPQLHEQMRERRIGLPVVYLTGQGSVSAGVRAIKDGAVDFLEKPVDEAALLAAIERALAQHHERYARQVEQDRITRCLGTLSPREREVMDHVIAGQLNKQIAADLGIAEKTVKVHRARAMQKMQVRSVAQLVRMCDTIGHSAWKSAPVEA